MRIKNIFNAVFIVIFAGSLLFVSCLSTKTGNSNYDAFRESRPTSILVLPPLNNSVEVDAPNVILASTIKPLSESGYYVLPVSVTQQMFRQNGIQTAADAHGVARSRLRDIFNADAALYITISEFGATFQVLRSIVKVRASARLVDLKTGVELWKCDIYYEEEPNKTSVDTGGGLAAQLIATVATAVVDQVANTLTNASYNVGSNAMHILLNADKADGILYGPYSPKYESD